MNVISYCDGIAVGREALRDLGFSPTYLASEIHGPSKSVAKRNHPDILHFGDMRMKIGESFDAGQFDLAMSGPPCQGFSMAGNRLDFKDPRSELFFTFVEEIKTLKPNYFLMENVPMSKRAERVISEKLGVEPIVINSGVFTGQDRRRLYWTNIPVEYPKQNMSSFTDVEGILDEPLNKNEVVLNYSSSGRGKNGVEGRFSLAPKSATLTKTGFSRRSLTAIYETKSKLEHGKFYPAEIEGMEFRESCPYILKSGSKKMKFKRHLTPSEWEKLQGLPVNYTMGFSDNQRKRMLGDAWTLPVIRHILSFMEF